MLPISSPEGQKIAPGVQISLCSKGTICHGQLLPVHDNVGSDITPFPKNVTATSLSMGTVTE